MHKVNLGELIKNGQAANRDAIHIAVVPVIAGETLQAGWHISLEDNKAVIAKNRDVSIGVVDPFYNSPIKEGETFWLLIKPNSITDLRHHWSHPAFKDKPRLSKNFLG